MANQHTSQPKKLKADEIARELVVPLDYLILEKLPDEGAVVGYHPLGSTVKHLATEFEGLESEAIAGRLKSMELYGLTLTVKTQPVSHGRGWQITALGKRVLGKWKGAGNGSASE